MSDQSGMPGEAPINDDDIAFIDNAVRMEEVDRRVHGVTNSEVLWGGPRGKGLVYIMADLTKNVTTIVEEHEKTRAEIATRQEEIIQRLMILERVKEAEDREVEKEKVKRQAATRRRERRLSILFKLGVPSLAWLALESLYAHFVQPLAAAHGVHLPTIPNTTTTAGP